MIKVGIIGAGRAGTAIIELLHQDPMVKIVCVCDLDINAPGIDLARRLKIAFVTDYRDLLNDQTDLVIDVTGSKSVRDGLYERPKHIEVIGGLSARFMWQLIEERIKSTALSEERLAKYSFENMVGKNAKVQEIFRMLPRIARTNSTVLIEGESGTGKELISHCIHQLSYRENKPYIRLNCAALSEGLLESELFGHVKGAFTGAITHKIGRFELADGGTLFLDEIGDISPSMQAKLLRVLQEGELERVGDAHSIKVDTRIIAATNKDLRRAVEEGRFRQDLYYRLRVVPLYMPPLRERKDDIPLLANHFVSLLNKELGRKITLIAPDALKLLIGYGYPGNIRELANIIEHAMVFCTGDTLLAEHIQRDIRPVQAQTTSHASEMGQTIRSLESDLIRKVLNETGWNYKKSAERLQIGRTTLWRKIKTYGLGRPQS